MQKIPTMFLRDESVKGHPVLPVVKPECQWVLDGEGEATVKHDGTNVKIQSGTLWKRQKPKDRDYDEASYVPCARTDPADRWAFEAFDRVEKVRDGVYELVGPKVQGNPDHLPAHALICVVPPADELVIPADHFYRTFDGIRDFLARNQYEGIVFHHCDGRMAKIKRRDFGLPWPPR